MPLKKRIDEVAKDLRNRAPRFRRIDAHDLAEALGIPDHWSPSGHWSFTRYAHIETLEEFAQNNSPALEIVYLLEDEVPEGRFRVLVKKFEALDAKRKPTFEFLTAGERNRLERALAKQQLEAHGSNGMNCIAHYSVRAASGRLLRFEAEVEDDGQCITLKTPYDFKDGGFVNLKDCLTDSW